MRRFRTWLEEDRGFDFWKNVILNYLSLDPKNGLSQNLEPLIKNNLKNKLQGLGEFTQLPPETQQEVMLRIYQPGTIGDLIRIMATAPVRNHV
jgi:hypothetical protein